MSRARLAWPQATVSRRSESRVVRFMLIGRIAKRGLCSPNSIPSTTRIAACLGRSNGVDRGVDCGVDSLRFPAVSSPKPAGQIARFVYEDRQLAGLEGMLLAA
jgi:hypothetical protein